MPSEDLSEAVKVHGTGLEELAPLPVFVVDGELLSGEEMRTFQLDSREVDAVRVLKGGMAKAEYGADAPEAIVEITLKKAAAKMPAETELAMRITVDSLLRIPEVSSMSPSRKVVLNPYLYPMLDSVSVPEGILDWAQETHGLRILSPEQIADRDTTVAILTLYPTDGEEGQFLHQTADLFYFESDNTAWADAWTFTVDCRSPRIQSMACRIVGAVRSRHSDYRSTASGGTT